MDIFQKWYDPNMKWNLSEYNVKYILFPINSLWTPEIQAADR